MLDNSNLALEENKSKYISIPKVYKDIGGFEFYELEKDLYLRTTSIIGHWVPPRLKAYIAKNSAAAGEKKLSSAGSIGYAVHKQIEMSVDPEHLNAAEMKLYENSKQAFIQFKREVEYKPLAYELTLASKTLGIAGTIDLVCEYKGKLCIFDWKTGFVGSSARWQLSAYKFLFEENFGEKIDCVAVKLSKHDASYFPIEYRNYDMSLRAYLGVLSAFQDEHYKILMEIWPKFWNKDFSKYEHKEWK